MRATDGPGATTRFNGLRSRTLTVLWGLPVAVATIWIGGWLLAFGVALFTAVGAWELWTLGRRWGLGEPIRWELAPAALAVLAGVMGGRVGMGLGLVSGMAVLVIGSVVRAAAAHDPEGVRRVLDGGLWGMLTLIYIPWFMGHMLLLRAGPDGLYRTLLVVILVWGGDVAAYIVGGSFGRHRLAASISPGKSVEGAIAAMIFVAAAAAATSSLLRLPVWAGALLGACISGAGLAGDLWESLLKRGAHVKDSGGAVPGHGGVLDRFDSLLFAAPVAFWLLAAWSLVPR